MSLPSLSPHSLLYARLRWDANATRANTGTQTHAPRHHSTQLPLLELRAAKSARR